MTPAAPAPIILLCFPARGTFPRTVNLAAGSVSGRQRRHRVDSQAGHSLLPASARAVYMIGRHDSAPAALAGEAFKAAVAAPLRPGKHR